MYHVQCTVHSTVHCTLCEVHCVQCTVPSALYTVQMVFILDGTPLEEDETPVWDLEHQKET